MPRDGGVLEKAREVVSTGARSRVGFPVPARQVFDARPTFRARTVSDGRKRTGSSERQGLTWDTYGRLVARSLGQRSSF
jgi:YD repeat-containing protein